MKIYHLYFEMLFFLIQNFYVSKVSMGCKHQLFIQSANQHGDSVWDENYLEICSNVGVGKKQTNKETPLHFSSFHNWLNPCPHVSQFLGRTPISQFYLFSDSI